MPVELFGLPTALVVLTLGAMAATLIGAYAVLSVVGGAEARLQRRVKRIRSRARSDAMPSAGSQQGVSLRKSDSDSGIRLVDALIKRYLPRPELMRRRLLRTGLEIKLGTYVMASVTLFGAALLAFVLWFGLSPTLASFLALPVGLAVPHVVIGYLIARRKQRFLALFPDAIDLIVRGLKSGLPVPESIRTVASEIGEPVGPEFGQVMDKVHLGNTLEESLASMSDRLDLPEFRFFVVSIAVQRETGGNLAETLENLSDILRKRRQAKLKVKALSAEARASAFIIGGLPFVMMAVLYTMNPDYIMPLFTDPRGIAMLTGAGIWMAIGIGVMWKMVRFEI